MLFKVQVVKIYKLVSAVCRCTAARMVVKMVAIDLPHRPAYTKCLLGRPRKPCLEPDAKNSEPCFDPESK